MNPGQLLILFLAACLLYPVNAMPDTDGPTRNLYLSHCASCHGADRLGGMGPALLPENLSRLKPAQAEQVIRNGRPLSPGLPSGPAGISGGHDEPVSGGGNRRPPCHPAGR